VPIVENSKPLGAIGFENNENLTNAFVQITKHRFIELSSFSPCGIIRLPQKGRGKEGTPRDPLVNLTIV